MEALGGFISSFLNVRLVGPLVAGIGLAATIGAGATAQLGAQRINEEIDALEVMGIRSVSYLASTRVIAGVIMVIPLYCIAVLSAFLATRVATTAVYGQSTGVYDHYFNTFLNPTDLIYSFLQAISMAIVVMLVHTYYGYNASGGPAGVGDAVGRAVRASLVAAVFVTCSSPWPSTASPATSTCPGSAMAEAIQKKRAGDSHPPGVWTLALLAAIVGVDRGWSVMFAGTLSSYVPVTLTSDRAGLVMEDGAKVKCVGCRSVWSAPSRAATSRSS